MPLGDTTLLDQIEDELVTALAPMLEPFLADGLKQIEIEPFSSGEDVAKLLMNFSSRIPGAFLNLPAITYNANQDVRAADMELEYGFLVTLDNTRAKTLHKKAAAYYFHDQFHKNLFYRKIANCDIPATLDFIRPGRWEVAESASGTMVTLVTFSINVRNWLVRELEQ